MRRRVFFFAVGPFGPAAFFISLSRGRVAAGVQQKPKKGATYGQRKYESGRQQKCRFGRLWIYCASRLADSEVGRVRRMRRVGRWFLEIGFESFAQDLATPSARSFAQDLASREGQRPRCPCGGESGSGDAAPPGVKANRGQRGRCPSRARENLRSQVCRGSPCRTCRTSRQTSRTESLRAC